MRTLKVMTILLLIISCFPYCYAADEMERVVVTTDYDAISAYDNGFAYDVMRSADGTAVILDNMTLIEDDAPGSGNSEKGTWQEELHRGLQVRKTFDLDTPRAFEANLVFYMNPKNSDKSKQKPFYIILNGERFEGAPLSWHENMWHWLEIPVKSLKQGENTLVLGCDAPEGEGYSLMIARADEYEAGGGVSFGNKASLSSGSGQAPADVDEQSGKIHLMSIGKNSAKSIDGGKTWTRMKLGTTNDVVGEYTIRLNLIRYEDEGSILSTPVDLWGDIPGHDQLIPQCSINDLRLFCIGETSDDTSITWQVRFSDSPDIMSDRWGDFETIGTGESVAWKPSGTNTKRYMQWKAVLQSSDPLSTPSIHTVKIKRELEYRKTINRFHVWKYENTETRHPSVGFSFENWDEPKLRVLRERLDLDKVIEGAVSDWDIINRVRHHVSSQWHHGSPLPDYPEWNALEILDRRDKVGKGGMCIQFSIVFIQCLASLGYQARHINMFAHETVEVYVDELGKWIHIDPESVFDSYEYETTTGMPINGLEQHRYFLQESGLSAEKPIDWQSTEPWTVWGSRNTVAGRPVPLDFSTYTGWINNPNQPAYPPQHRLAGFMRMMPRNDYFSNPYPRPLSQGSSNWPWNGYLNWYDEASPRKLQYSNHTDREVDFYPTLNCVEFDAVQTDREDELLITMLTFAPNFDGFEINVNDTGWENSDAQFKLKLRPSALNTLSMRVKNKLGPKGKESALSIMYHYKEPFTPRAKDW